MKSKKSKTEMPQYKIVPNDRHPFFNAYHGDEYIISHDCRSTVAVSENDILFLVELKRPEREYAHALEQIIDTIKLLIIEPKISVSKLNARVVLRKYPNVLTAKERKLENSIIGNYRCDLQNCNKTMTETLP